MSQDNKKKEYICPFCGCKMIVYESIESWLECSYCHFETQMHTCLGGAIEFQTCNVNTLTNSQYFHKLSFYNHRMDIYILSFCYLDSYFF